jgi:UDP:flavonoid glycosyltransferase YjiC (YdhE family)
MRPLARPWYRFRAELGLPPTREDNPLTDSHSPELVLAPFSRVLAEPQPDWPPQTVLTGFPFHVQDGAGGPAPALERFLEAGPPPVVFTLGASTAWAAGSFYEASTRAAQLLRVRAVLVLADPRNRPAALPENIMAINYAPFTELLPRAAAMVYHGGIGTTGLALRAGRPMLIVPTTYDQPDNAERLVRLGVGRSLSPRRYTPARVAAELCRLLHDPEYARRARTAGEQVQQEDGVQAACDALENLLPVTP